jgi:tetratricopeptide (TPR) repeat protein
MAFGFITFKSFNMYSSSKYFITFGLACIAIILTSCKKDWLDAKPDKSLVVPSSLKDYQALLDNNSGGAAPFNSNQSVLGEISSGDFYVSDDTWESVSPVQRNAYIWSSSIYGDDREFGAWTAAYNCISYANVILEGIENIKPIDNGTLIQWKQIKGSALFFRAYRHFEIAQLFCKPFDKNSASSDLGIPLRLHSDFNIVSKRSSIEETYKQILDDLIEALDLLPLDQPGINDKIYRLRPTKAAVYAMLARVYLSMASYDDALKYANKTLDLYNVLMDYNLDVYPSGDFRIPQFNKEVIFHMTGASEIILGVAQAMVDSILVNSYKDNDLRKSLFIYDPVYFPAFVGNYTESETFFTGLATDEVYLTIAECNARMGNKDAALGILNILLKNRWNKNVPYLNITAANSDEALKKILEERRKELCFRGIRWTDLRRLNKESRFAVTLNRKVKGINYTLPPNSPKYVLPIPTEVIQLTGMQQNPR